MSSVPLLNLQGLKLEDMPLQFREDVHTLSLTVLTDTVNITHYLGLTEADLVRLRPWAMAGEVGSVFEPTPPQSSHLSYHWLDPGPHNPWREPSVNPQWRLTWQTTPGLVADYSIPHGRLFPPETVLCHIPRPILMGALHAKA